MLARFTPSAAAAVVRAGMLATRAGRGLLGTDFLLLALTEAPTPPLARCGVTAAAVRAEIDRGTGGAGPPDDRALLAALGVDLDEVRRRAARITATPLDDPALWQLRRSRVRPLRLTLVGPTGDLTLDGPSRKVIEVALWARGGRALAGGEDLLWGLLADGSNHSVRILVRLGVDLRQLWAELRRWHAAA